MSDIVGLAVGPVPAVAEPAPGAGATGVADTVEAALFGALVAQLVALPAATEPVATTPTPAPEPATAATTVPALAPPAALSVPAAPAPSDAPAGADASATRAAPATPGEPAWPGGEAVPADRVADGPAAAPAPRPGTGGPLVDVAVEPAAEVAGRSEPSAAAEPERRLVAADPAPRGAPAPTEAPAPGAAAPAPTPRTEVPAALPSAGEAAPPAAPLHEAVPAQLSARLQHLRHAPDGRHELTLDLHPAELGRVAVDVVVDAGTVHVTLRPEQVAAGDLLRASLGELRHLLDDAGLLLGDLGLAPHDRHDDGRRRDDGPERGGPGDPAAGSAVVALAAAAHPLPTDADRVDVLL